MHLKNDIVTAKIKNLNYYNVVFSFDRSVVQCKYYSPFRSHFAMEPHLVVLIFRDKEKPTHSDNKNKTHKFST